MSRASTSGIDESCSSTSEVDASCMVELGVVEPRLLTTFVAPLLLSHPVPRNGSLSLVDSL